MRASRRAATFFPLAASYLFYGNQEAREGLSEAWRSLRHEEEAIQGGEE
jgi:hypothetical protein